MVLDYDPTRSALYTPEQRDSLFIRGHTYTPLQLAIEGARLAYYRVETSASERQRLAEALDRAGFGPPTIFAHAATGSEAFGAIHSSDASALLAFRGTQPGSLEDLFTDARADFTGWPESAGRVHAGFAAAARALLPEVRAWLAANERAATQLILTGHSLGAALATLTASSVRASLLVTLGSPRVGDAAFARTIKCPSVRLVHCCDLVTDLPPPVGGYVHVGWQTYLTRGGDSLADPPAAIVRRDRFAARATYPFTYAWRRGAVLVRDLADHAPINYARSHFAPVTE